MTPRAVVTFVTAVSAIVALFMFLPTGVGLLYGETTAPKHFAITGFAVLGISGIILLLKRLVPAVRNSDMLSARGAFLAVSLAWILASLFGAIPFYTLGVVPNFADAYFETMSGFTTTGASIFSDVEILPKTILFWRSLTHWLGGMGIVVLAVAVLPMLGIGGLQLIEAEAPGPSVDKITPRIKETAKILWYIYLGVTVLETVLLMLGGMNLFDSLTHSFGTVATGGFSTKNLSVGYYHSAYIEWVITIFMLISGANFVLHYHLLRGRFADVFRNSEFKAYFLIVFITVAAIAVELILRGVHNGSADSIRHAFFQVASIITTTGFATDDFAKWPHFSQAVLFFVMFIGGCSGSTGGGIKVIRFVTLFKLAMNEMKFLVHPRGVFSLMLDGKRIGKNIVYSITGFFFFYIAFILVTTLVVASANYDVTTSITTALATTGNIGPGLSLVGPMANYQHYPNYVVWWLSFAMLVGRLEIYTVLILFSRIFWRR